MEAVDEATTNHHWPFISKPSWRLLVLRLLPLRELVLLLPLSHKLVQLGTKGVQVTSKDSRHTFLQPSREEDTQWWRVIVLDQSGRMQALVVRGRRDNLLLAPRRSIRLMLHMDIRDRAKAKVNHLGVGDTSELLASQGKERASIATSLDILDGITHRG